MIYKQENPLLERVRGFVLGAIRFTISNILKDSYTIDISKEILKLSARYMNTSGIIIGSSDVYIDTYAQFFDLYNDGSNVDEISKRLITDNHEVINDIDHCNHFWFALAKAQWECGKLDNNIFNQVKNIIEMDIEIEALRRIRIDEIKDKDIQNYKIVLAKFLLDLSKNKSKPKLRKKKIVLEPIFEKGDCLVFNLQDGYYGGAVVLEAFRDGKYPRNLIALIMMHLADKPTEQEYFENAKIITTPLSNLKVRPHIMWYNPIGNERKEVLGMVEKVTNIEIQTSYSYGFPFSTMFSFKTYMIETANDKLCGDSNVLSLGKTRSIKEYIKLKNKYLDFIP